LVAAQVGEGQMQFFWFAKHYARQVSIVNAAQDVLSQRVSGSLAGINRDDLHNSSLLWGHNTSIQQRPPLRLGHQRQQQQAENRDEADEEQGVQRALRGVGSARCDASH